MKTRTSSIGGRADCPRPQEAERAGLRGRGQCGNPIVTGRRGKGAVHRDQLTATLLPTIEAMRAGQVCFPARIASAFRRPVLSTARNSDRSRA